jgi:DNA sulfur modification protein DndB
MSQQNISLPPLILPGLRAAMGDWVYYICFLKMRDISTRISMAEEIHSSKSLRDLLQRELKRRSLEIADYLLSQDQRFFNALVVGTYGGSPKWYELDISNSESDLGMLPDDIEGTLGLLKLDGGEMLFAIDGQHRVAGIRKAVEKQSELGSEEICVIFLAGVAQGHRDDDPVGFQRTRRLFTTLNRYAKPVGKKDIIAVGSH